MEEIEGGIGQPIELPGRVLPTYPLGPGVLVSYRGEPLCDRQRGMLGRQPNVRSDGRLEP